MHQTGLPLGKYHKDPRFEIVQVRGRDAIRTAEYTIVQGDGRVFEIWRLDEPTAIFPHHTERVLAKALSHVLGDAMKVGPVYGGRWLHTDGHTYEHDPATTAMRRAQLLHLGDIVDYPSLPAFEVTGPAQPYPDEAGRPGMAFPTRDLVDRSSGWLPYRDGDLVPVRTGR